MIKAFLKRIFTYKFHVRGYINPFIGLQMNLLGNFSGVTECKRAVPVIVSLTSFHERFKDLPKTIYSLLNQSLKPDRIILWLDNEDEDLMSLPYEITRFVKNGLEIRFVKDLKSYTKAIYAFKEFESSIIVTADDDIYYPQNWLKKLYLSYVTYPQDIQVHRAHRAVLNLPYEKWQKQIKEESARYDNFLTGAGGVLYPPNCFKKEALREDIFLKYAPNADDIWFWVMSLISGRKIRVVKNHEKSLICTNIAGQLFSKTLYSKNRYGGNDEQLNNLMKLYGSNVTARISQK